MPDNLRFSQRIKMAWDILTNKSYSQSIELNQLFDFLGISGTLSEDALKEATYFACMKVLSECMGKLPLKVMQHTDKAGTLSTEIQKHPRRSAFVGKSYTPTCVGKRLPDPMR